MPTSAPLATLAPELVGRGPGRGVAGDSDGDGVLAGLERDVLGDRRLAALAPRLELVLAGQHAAEREVALVVREDVGRRRDHRDVCAHVRVEVTAEPDDSLFLELVLAGLADLVDAEIE